MLVVLTFSVVICVILPPCLSIDATITPANHAIFELGSNVTLYCHLHSSPDSRTAADIVWYRGGEALPGDYYGPINDTVSRLHKSNAAFEPDSGSYACSFPGETADQREGIYVTVAAPPDPVRNLTCRTPNTVMIYCNWWDGLAETNVVNKHSVQWMIYRPPFTPKWTVQHHKHMDGSYSCSFEIEVEKKIQVVVTTENLVGSAESRVVLDPSNEVVPNQPTSVQARPGSLNESRYLDVTWEEPAEWGFYPSLKYRIRYRDLTTQQLVEVPGLIESRWRWYRIENLVQYTNYKIGVSARSATADPIQSDLYWSDWGEIEARTDEGAPLGNASEATIGLETDGSTPDLRDVNLQWKPVPDKLKGSSSIVYEVTLSPQDDREGRPLHTHKNTSEYNFVEFQGLHRYQTYRVFIQAMNEYGAGPIADFGDVIPDRTGRSSEPLNLTATVIRNILKVTWQPPENPNGIVENYRVTVAGNVPLASNQTAPSQDSKMSVLTESLEHLFEIDCTDLYSTLGETLEVSVFTVTRSFTDHLFEGDLADSVVDGVCLQIELGGGVNIVLWAIMIPMTVIICCVIVLALWRFCQEFWVEPPDPEYPKSIISNGQFRDMSFHTPKPLEREHFDELRPQMGTAPNSSPPDITRGQQTGIDPYKAHPSNLPKVLRNLSHDSGFSGPESPSGEAIDIDTVFRDNHSFRAEVIPEDPELREPHMSEGDLDGNDWRNSVFSSGSSDSGAEVRHESVTTERTLIASTASATTDPSDAVDPYTKVSDLPGSPRGCSSPTSMAPGVDTQDTTDDRESLVCDEDDGTPEDHGYLRQYQLSPVPGDMPEIDGVNSYLAMAAHTPPRTGFPNGYVPGDDMGHLTRFSDCPTPDLPSTPDGYQPFSRLERQRGESSGLNNNGYVDHRNLKAESVPEPIAPVSVDDYVKRTSITSQGVDDYVKHQSTSSSSGVDYRDDYDPGFMGEVGVDDGIEGKDPCKGVGDGYVQHLALGPNPPVGFREPVPRVTSSGGSVESQMPYCKLTQGD